MPKSPSEEERKRPGPKPRGPFQDKRRTLTTRITESTRRRLEQEAHAHDRSLSQHIELLIEQALATGDERVDAFGGAETYNFMKAIGAAVSAISTRAGASWFNDPKVYREAEKAAFMMFEAFRPKPKGRGVKQVMQGLGREEAAKVLRRYADDLEGKTGEKTEADLLKRLERFVG